MSRSTFLREPCAGSREDVGEASVAARVGGAIERRNLRIRSAETLSKVEGNTGCAAMARHGRASRRRRTQARTYVLCRDLRGLLVVLGVPGTASERR